MVPSDVLVPNPISYEGVCQWQRGICRCGCTTDPERGRGTEVGHGIQSPKRRKREGQNRKEGDYGNKLKDVTYLLRKPSATRSLSTLIEASHVPDVLCYFPACCVFIAVICKHWIAILPALRSTSLGPYYTCSLL